MALNTAKLARAIDLATDGSGVPTAVKLFSAGDVDTTKGVFKFTQASAKAVLAAATDYGNDLMFDYEHASVAGFSVDPAEAGKAAGWFRPEVRGGELWAADIRWTPAAAKKIADKEYRYVSPTFCHTEDGEVRELVNAALTNMPATKKMAPLMASRKEQDKMDPKLLASLGLAPTASQDEVMAVIAALNQSREQVAAMNKRLADMEAAARAAEVASLVEAGKADGKIAPAMLDWAKGQSPEALRAFLAVAPKLVTVAPSAPPAPDAKPASTATLSAADVEIAKQLGVDPTKMLARKAAGVKRVATPDEDDD